MQLPEETIKILATRVDEIGLDVRAAGALANDGVYYVVQVARHSVKELKAIPNFGKAGLAHIEHYFKSHGLELGFLEQDRESARLDLPEEFTDAMWTKKYRTANENTLAVIRAQDVAVLETLQSRFGPTSVLVQEQAPQVVDQRTAVLANWLKENLPESTKGRNLTTEFLRSAVSDPKVVQEIDGILKRAVLQKLARDGGPA